MVRVWLVRLVAAATVLSALLPAAAEEKGGGSGDASVETGGTGSGLGPAWFHVLQEYRGRIASGTYGAGDDAGLVSIAQKDESDHDLRLFLEGGLHDPAGAYSAELALGAWYDLDGEIPQNEFSTFSSIRDSSDSYWLDVYSVSAAYHTDGMLKEVRGGRQTAPHGLPTTFDGLTLELEPVHHLVELAFFGGRTVHFFEEDADLFEDWLASAGIALRPSESLKFELDYLFAMEDTELEKGLVEHEYGATVWFRGTDWLYLKGYGRAIGSVFSHSGFATRAHSDSADLGLDLSFDAQTATIKEVNEALNPYFAILGKSLPHARWKADLWKNFSTGAGDYAVHAGWNGRLLLDGEEETSFNREFGKLYLLLHAADIGVKGPFAAFSLDNHFASLTPEFSGDEGMLTVGGSAGYERCCYKAEVGTYYQRFKYNYYRDVEEISDVRTYFGAVSYKPLNWLKLNARYQLEQFDWNVHTVIFSLSQTL